MLAPGCLTGRSAWLCTPFPSMMQSAALPHSAPGICWPPVQAGIRQCPASWLTTVTLMISCAFPFRPPISYMIPSQAGLYSVLFSLPGSFPCINGQISHCCPTRCCGVSLHLYVSKCLWRC